MNSKSSTTIFSSLWFLSLLASAGTLLLILSVTGAAAELDLRGALKGQWPLLGETIALGLMFGICSAPIFVLPLLRSAEPSKPGFAAFLGRALVFWLMLTALCVGAMIGVAMIRLADRPGSGAGSVAWMIWSVISVVAIANTLALKIMRRGMRGSASAWPMVLASVGVAALALLWLFAHQFVFSGAVIHPSSGLHVALLTWHVPFLFAITYLNARLVFRPGYADPAMADAAGAADDDSASDETASDAESGSLSIA